IFTLRPGREAVEEARRNRARPADQPRDTLAILDLTTGSITKVARVRSFTIPASGGGWVAYVPEAESTDSAGGAGGRAGAAGAPGAAGRAGAGGAAGAAAAPGGAGASARQARRKE